MLCFTVGGANRSRDIQGEKTKNVSRIFLGGRSSQPVRSRGFVQASTTEYQKLRELPFVNHYHYPAGSLEPRALFFRKSALRIDLRSWHHFHTCKKTYICRLLSWTYPSSTRRQVVWCAEFVRERGDASFGTERYAEDINGRIAVIDVCPVYATACLCHSHKSCAKKPKCASRCLRFVMSASSSNPSIGVSRVCGI